MKYENFKRKEYNPFRLFKSLFRYATQRFKQTEKNQVKSGDLTLRKIDDCLFAIYKIIQANALWDSSIQKPVFGITIRVGRAFPFHKKKNVLPNVVRNLLKIAIGRLLFTLIYNQTLIS